MLFLCDNYLETFRTILHGGLKKQELNKICKFFCIKKELAYFDTDFHYTLNPIL